MNASPPTMAGIPQGFQSLTISGSEQDAAEDLLCPFCSAIESDFKRLQKHVQSRHPDQIESTNSDHKYGRDVSDADLAQLLAFEEAGIPSALALEDFPSGSKSRHDDNVDVSGDNELWIDCFCGERVLQQEIDLHSSRHQAEMEDGGDDEEAEHGSRPVGESMIKHDQTPKPAGQGQQQMQTRRLGKSELGPYAHEERMPRWLHNMLAKNVGVRREEVTVGRQTFSYPALENETSMLVPRLQLISRADRSVTYSAFCSPVVNHVRKLFQEGGFCGYRNIQMLITYLRAQPANSSTFAGRLPTIFELQDAIEAAWDRGIHAVGRIETGGIKNTRKYIGTSEAQAFFTAKGVGCRTQAFKSTGDMLACDALLTAVKNYFAQAHAHQGHGKARLAPIYLQYKGHSMTIVGFEEMVKGGPNLVVFDPLFRVNRSLKRMSLNTTQLESKRPLVRNHRFSRHHLKRYDQFEFLFLEGA